MQQIQIQIDYGAYVLDSNKEYHLLNGNLTGCLIAEYLLSQKQKANTLPSNGVVITTIVSSNLLGAIAKNYNIKKEDVLTGFKWVGLKMLELETENKGTFLFAYEESYGYLVGNEVRDKDAVISAMFLSEIAAFCKANNKTIWDYIIDIYEKYGYYIEGADSVWLEGLDGQAKIKTMMDNLRKNPLFKVGDYRVLSISDYKENTSINLETKEITGTGLPNSNVLYYELENNSWLCARPSGTEPKIKFYYGLKGTSLEDAENKSLEFKNSLKELMNSVS